MQISRLQPQIVTSAAAFPRKAILGRIWKRSLSIYGIMRVGLGAVFIWSGGIKLLAPQSFVVIIESYGLIADVWVLPAALCLAAIELLAGVGLIFDLKGALGLIAGMLLLFMAILGYGLWLGLDVDCGCFGPHDPEAEAYHGMRFALYRDAVMLAVVAYIYFQRHKRAQTPLKTKELYNIMIAYVKGDRKR